jgi:hypothetical protein
MIPFEEAKKALSDVPTAIEISTQVSEVAIEKGIRINKLGINLAVCAGLSLGYDELAKCIIDKNPTLAEDIELIEMVAEGIKRSPEIQKQLEEQRKAEEEAWRIKKEEAVKKILEEIKK